MEKIPDYQAIIGSPVGKLGISTRENCLIGIDYLPTDMPLIKPKTLIAKDILEQLLCYFSDPSYCLDIPFQLNTESSLTHQVLTTLPQITVGTTIQYGVFAKRFSTHARCIGAICRSNPIPLVLPCHRVIGQSNIGGYAGTQTHIKKWLLAHEGYL